MSIAEIAQTVMSCVGIIAAVIISIVAVRRDKSAIEQRKITARDKAVYTIKNKLFYLLSYDAEKIRAEKDLQHEEAKIRKSRDTQLEKALDEAYKDV